MNSRSLAILESSPRELVLGLSWAEFPGYLVERSHSLNSSI